MTTWEAQLREKGISEQTIRMTMEEGLETYREARDFAQAIEDSLKDSSELTQPLPESSEPTQPLPESSEQARPLPEHFDIGKPPFRVKCCSVDEVLKWKRRQVDDEAIEDADVKHILEVLRSNASCRTFMQENWRALVELFGFDEKTVWDALE